MNPSHKTTSILVCAAAALGQAQTVGNEQFAVPAFSCFGDSPVEKYDMTVVESDLSGVTYDPETKNVFAVNNGDRKAYEVSKNDGDGKYNTLVQSWDLSSYTLDLEGISALGGRKFAITDENPAKIITVTLNADGTVSDDTEVSSGITPAAGSNLGFEGVAGIGSDFYAVQEAQPPKLWVKKPSVDIEAVTGDLREADNSGFKILSIGGLTRGGDSTDEVFLVVKNYEGAGRDGSSASYLQKGIFRYNLSSKTVTERFGGEVCSMGQPEGLTFWKDGDKIKMLVTGEKYEARIYEADASCTDTVGQASTAKQTCEEKKVSTAGCEKTYPDGGCTYTRCNKDITPHTKICTDDEPGETDCSEHQCFNHCINSNFASTSDASGMTCTHWAYDVKEKECYIFAGCTDEAWDEDYTLYTLYDNTCERTREDYPLGCQNRRCNKDISTHNKICTDDEPGVTDCDLDACEQKCRDHKDFSCTTYAWDRKEKECYLFATCEGETYDEDYSTYVLVDPTCDRLTGCPNRRCDKDKTTHEKVCTDDSADTQCTLEQCEAKCSEWVAPDNSEAFCTHWAWDEVDQECYVFHGCVDEAFNDDYVLYPQAYGKRLELVAAAEEARRAAESSDDSDNALYALMVLNIFWPIAIVGTIAFFWFRQKEEDKKGLSGSTEMQTA